jgi:hypothetical protein
MHKRVNFLLFNKIYAIFNKKEIVFMYYFARHFIVFTVVLGSFFMTGCNLFKNSNTLVDTTAPVIIGADDLSIEVGSSTPNWLTGVTANDNYEGDITESITVDSSEVNLDVVGVYSLTYSVTDGVGNEDSITIDVNVVDTTVPVIIGADDLSVEVGSSTPNWLTGVTANDNYDGDITESITVDSSEVNLDVVGVYSLTYSVTDGVGNEDNKTIEVEVMIEVGATYIINDLALKTVISNEKVVYKVVEGSEANSDTLYIPSHVGDIPIISISSSVFYYNARIRNLIIEEGVTDIGSNAFFNCSNLTNVTIPDSVVYVGFNAFDNTNWYDEQPNGIVKVGKVAYEYKGEIPETIIIDNDIKVLSDSLFKGATNLTNVTIPDSVTNIGSGVFYSCTNLRNITIPESVVDVGSFAFYDTAWYNAQPNGIVKVGKTVYKYKGPVPSSLTIDSDIKSIGARAFEGCKSLTSITIPNSVTSIGTAAFQYSGLINVTIPSSVTNIGFSAFESSSIVSISVDVNNETYSSTDGVLYNKSKSTLVRVPQVDNFSIPNTVRIIASGAFSSSGIKSVVIPSSITKIDTGAFRDCESLTNITIPNSVTSIGARAFAHCESLTNITIPNSVTSIGDQAFHSCTSLASITIPNSVTSIGQTAFCNCTSLTNITLPSNISVIDDRLVQDATSLTSFKISANITTIGDWAFYNTVNLKTVIIDSEIIANNITDSEVQGHLTNYFTPNDSYLYILDSILTISSYITNGSNFEYLGVEEIGGLEYKKYVKK